MCSTHNVCVKSLPKFDIVLQLMLEHNTAIGDSVIKLVYLVNKPVYSVIKLVYPVDKPGLFTELIDKIGFIYRFMFTFFTNFRYAIHFFLCYHPVISLLPQDFISETLRAYSFFYPAQFLC